MSVKTVYQAARRVMTRITTSLTTSSASMRIFATPYNRVAEKYRWRVENKEYLRTSRMAIRASIIALVLGLVALLSFPQPSSAYTFEWTQSSWSGGVGSSTSSQYSSGTNVETTDGIALTNLERVSNTTFNSNLSNWTTGSSEVAPQVVQQAYLNNTSSAISSYSVTLPTTVQQNNTLIVTFNTRGAPGNVTLPDFTLDANVANTSSLGVTQIYRKLAGASESSTVTITLETAQLGYMSVLEVTGIDPVSPVDQVATGQTGTTLSTNYTLPSTGTTTQANEIAIAAAGHSSVQTYSGWTNGFLALNSPPVSGNGYTGFKELTSKQVVSTVLQGQVNRAHHGAIVTYRGAHTSNLTEALPGVRQSNTAAYSSLATMTANYLRQPLEGNTLFAAFITQHAPAGITAPEGWVQVAAPQMPAGTTTALYMKTATASESTAVTFTLNNTTSGRIDIYEIRGLVSANTVDRLYTNANLSANPVTFGITAPTQNNELLLGVMAFPNSSGMPTSWAANGFMLGFGSLTAGWLTTGVRPLPVAQDVNLSFVNSVPRTVEAILVSLRAGRNYVTATRDTGTVHAGSGSAKIESSPWTLSRFTQSVNVGDTKTYAVSAYARTTGSAVTSSDVSLYYNGEVLTTNYESVGSGWYKLSSTITGENAAHDVGVVVSPNRTVYLDDFSVNRYEETGTLTSNIYDAGQLANWGTVDYVESGTGTVSVRVRSSNSSSMAGAPNFTTCAVIESGDDISSGTNGCVNDAERYIQYQITLEPLADAAPTFSSITVHYEGADNTAPEDNASSIAMYRTDGGDSVSLNAWTNAALPYFTWDPGVDDDGGVGVAGYCVYLGQDSGADPITTKGLLGTGDLDTHDTCPFATEETFLNLSEVGILETPLSTSNTAYYLLVKAIDGNGNVYSGDAESFHFRFDNVAPTNPAYITSPSSFISTKTATLTWPTSTGDAPADANAGVAGLQYKIGASGTWYGDGHTGDEDFSDLLDNDGSYTTQDIPDFANIIEGSNVIYFRTFDEAGNVSVATVTTSLKVNTSGAPSSPQNIVATPSVNTSNSFAFSWIAPATYVGSSSTLTYCYTVNTLPTAQNCTFTSPGQLSIPAGPYATQPGTNIFYVVARDESMSINYATAGSVEFTANTSAPGMPLNMDIADTSVRASENWRLVISWEPPTDIGAGVSSYKVYRSTDGENFVLAGSTSGTSYVDTGLESVEYTYHVRACDSANNCGSNSEEADKTPTGRYTTPPLMTSEGGVPHISGIDTRSATISWTTDRNADSKVAFGLSSGNYGSTEAYSSKQTPNHEVQLDNLSPGTTYYFVVRWTDTDGNTGTSSELVFETLPPPSVQDVSVTSLGLTEATLQYTTSGASGVKIYYGKTNAFGAVIEASTSGDVSTYLAQLKDLSDGTKYFYKINPLDVHGFEYEGTTITLETPPAPRITNLRFQPVENEPSSSQLVSWETNIPTTSELVYGVVGGDTLTALDTAMTTTHEIKITQLIDDSQYTLTARSRDINGNLAQSDAQTFKTALDTRPPTVTDIAVVPSIRGTGAEARGQIIVSWKTDEPSTSQVIYGEGTSGDLSNSSAKDERLTYDHAVVISDLSTSKVYRIQVVSYDKGDNKATGDPQTAIIGRGTQNALAIIFSILQKIFGVEA